MYGMNIIGFKTIGRPNIIGSLMLKIPGAADNLETVMYALCLRATIKIAMIKPIVAPVPPKLTKESKKGLLTM